MHAVIIRGICFLHHHHHHHLPPQPRLPQPTLLQSRYDKHVRPYLEHHLTLLPPLLSLLPPIQQEATPTAATTERNEEQQQEQKFKPVQEIAFPWREAPRQDLSFFDSLYKTMNEFMPQ